MLSWSSLLLVLCTTFFPCHWLLSHITIFKTVVSSEKGMNPVAMTIINPQKARDSTLTSCSQVIYATVCTVEALLQSTMEYFYWKQLRNTATHSNAKPIQWNISSYRYNPRTFNCTFMAAFIYSFSPNEDSLAQRSHWKNCGARSRSTLALKATIVMEGPSTVKISCCLYL